MKQKINSLESKLLIVQSQDLDILNKARYWKDEVLACMNELREVVDILETKVDENDWPMPTYIDLLFGIK